MRGWDVRKGAPPRVPASPFAHSKPLHIIRIAGGFLRVFSKIVAARAMAIAGRMSS